MEVIVLLTEEEVGPGFSEATPAARLQPPEPEEIILLAEVRQTAMENNLKEGVLVQEAALECLEEELVQME